jgi:methylenetetrahydrofolate dehydrogenase (NADP+) / methenyltetrahydrofolate cyclohydrolase
MPATVIDGKAIAEAVNRETALEAASLLSKHGRRPGLAVVLVGDNPASQVYVSTKVKKCQELGIYSERIVLPKDCEESELLARIAELNANPAIHGILVQSPPPPQIDEAKVVEAILPSKDVDCFHPENVGRMLLGDAKGFLPCTPWGVMELLARSGIKTAGKRAVVLGRSNIVGKPMAALLLQKGADSTVTVCHSRTKDMEAVCREADILIAAIGRPEFVKASMVKDGAVVIDVGINRVSDPSSPKGSKLLGDVAYAEVAAKASFITPVPGGVGPMTIAMLMKNAVKACRMSFDLA